MFRMLRVSFVAPALALALVLCAGMTTTIQQAEAKDMPVSNDQTRFFFAKPLLLGAHRGGRSLWPENTMEAFRNTAERWPEALLEGDAHLSSDGHVVLMHDDTVNRTTDGTGPISGMTLAELKALDAGYRFTRDGGQTFPFRGKGIQVPTLEELIVAFPEARILIEMKFQEGLAEAVLEVLHKTDSLHRVALASFAANLMQDIRATEPRLICCYDFVNGMEMIQTRRGGDWEAYEPAAQILALDENMIKGFELTKADFEALNKKGIAICVHTINREDRMRALLDMGVTSILSDRPDLLAEVIASTQSGQAPSTKP